MFFLPAAKARALKNAASDNTVWQFATAGTVKFGRGSRNQLAVQLAKRELRHPLVVTDKTVGSLPRVAELLNELSSDLGGMQVFDGCVAEPTIAIVEDATRAGSAHSIDCIIGIGGGSNLDVAKLVSAVLKHGGRPRDYFGFDRIPGPTLPLFALPTTAGTGSEVSHSAVLTDIEQGVKVSTLSPWLRPTCAIVDPVLTDSCPPLVTAHSGIDALVHAIEAFTNRDFTEMVGVDPQSRAYEGSYALTRMLASEAIRLVGRSLVAAVKQPHQTVARDEMALAAMLAGMAFSNSGVGIVHALEYPIGALTHCGHGEGNGLLLPHVMRYNLPVRIMEFCDIARWLGANVVGLSQRKAAEQAIEMVVDLQQEIGIRTQLRELGMQEKDIPSVAAKAFEIKRLMDINPQTPELADLETILRQAF